MSAGVGLPVAADTLTRAADCLIWSNEHGAWWAPNEVGYTTVFEEAGRYPPDMAVRIVAKATCDGQLTVTREGRLGERLTVPPEVLVVLAGEEGTDG